jgi:hypothetical protein
VTRFPLKIQDSRVRIPLFRIAPPQLVARPFLKWTRRIVTSAVLPLIYSNWDVPELLVQEAARVRVTPFPSIVMLFVITGRALASAIVVPAGAPLKLMISTS